MASEILNIWAPSQPGLSLTIWAAMVIVLMYTARAPAHKIILSLTRSIRNALRIISHSIFVSHGQLIKRNREVLLTQGRDTTERLLEREFQRVEELVNRDLSGYPALQRDLKDQITRIDEYYIESGEVPPQPPEWLDVVDSVAKIPSSGSPAIAKILTDINLTLKKALATDVAEYRNANKQRHQLLRKMMPYWRKLSKVLCSVEKKITGLEKRSNIIDEKMTQYEQILSKSDYAERMLSSSSLTQFFVSGLVLFVAIIGGFVNFQLIALPLSEMVGAGSYIGSVKSSDVAALFVITVEITLGLFLMESIGVTRLFPIISMLDENKRKIIVWVTFSFLLVLACVESSLAYMRDMLAADSESLNQMLAGVQVAQAEFRWIPSVGQMAMAFILPFVLTFVAIPLESFIHSFRTVIGLFLVWLLRMLIFIIRLAANLINGVGLFVVNLYDLIIFIPLRLEQAFKKTDAPSVLEKPLNVTKENIVE